MSSRASRLHSFLCIALAAALGACTTADWPQDEALPEGRWELVNSSFVESGRLPGLPRPTLDIGAGRLSAFSGCNRGEAAVRATAGRLAVTGLAIARRPCPEPVGSFDASYFRLLRHGPVYHVRGDSLQLIAGDDNALFRKR